MSHESIDNDRCKTCGWYSPMKVDQEDPAPIYAGYCHKRVPETGDYPVVFCNDWCSDYKPKERTL